MSNKFWKNKKVLITGHTGFTGIWISSLLISYGAKITGISIESENKPDLFQELEIKTKIKNFKCDVKNYLKLKKIITKCKPQIVIHLAAQSIVSTGYNDPYGTFVTNVFGTTNLLEILKNQKSIKTILISTTDKVYRNNEKKRLFLESDSLGGDDPYAASKSAKEIIINSFYKSFFEKKKIGLVTVRSGNILGGGDWNKNRLIPDLMRFIYFKKKFHLRVPNSIRPWQHILDVINIYSSIIPKLHKNHKLSGSYNIGPSKNTYKVSDILMYLKKNVKDIKLIKTKKRTTFKENKFLLLNTKKINIFFKLKNLLTFKEVLSLTFNWYKNYCEGSNPNTLIANDIDFLKKKILFFNGKNNK